MTLTICKKCGHGEPHHKGHFAECTCPVQVAPYTYRPCNCPTYDPIPIGGK